MSSDNTQLNSSTTGPIATTIIEKLNTELPNIEHFEIYNDSYKHSGHHGISESSNRTESHFRLVIVSDIFEKLSQPKRHRLIYKILQDELNGSVHALQLKTKTPEEYNK
ncbi:Bol1p SCDLUD_003346 [Saccharomycodes ludwigii]|uniref:Bol1p n=1 Tax=Saccharomycodes ludwigii TaxID=36035 RepID=UPI001E8343F1|nr:hypothetical protein SCDLUD_003346 [Saccharomycodes ludwigii]KAH3900371.1 hypothetical protein SCDLUD_003346 [Saccharomycodes ludwigii]